MLEGFQGRPQFSPMRRQPPGRGVRLVVLEDPAVGFGAEQEWQRENTRIFRRNCCKEFIFGWRNC